MCPLIKPLSVIIVRQKALIINHRWKNQTNQIRAVSGETRQDDSHDSRVTHLGPPHSIAEALTIGTADMATGSMVRELFSTALWTRWDSCGEQESITLT